MKNKFEKAFTLIELLVVIAIISILATVVFVALDPATRFADARDSRRWNDVNSILTAAHQCIVDNGGSMTACGLGTTGVQNIGTTGLDLSTSFARYLKSIPQDPQVGTAVDTGYDLEVDANNMITVSATNAENTTVQVSR